jgi:hypothetical protein
MEWDGSHTKDDRKSLDRRTPAEALAQLSCQWNEDRTGKRGHECHNRQRAAALPDEPGIHYDKGWLIQQRRHRDANANPDQIKRRELFHP